MAFECNFCSRVLTTERGLIAHTEAKHGRRGTHRAMRAWESGRDQLGHLTLAGSAAAAGEASYDVDDDAYDWDREEWVCYFCCRGFAARHHLEQHLNSGTHEESRYHCKGCGKQFKTLSGLQQHADSTSCGSYSRRLVQVAVQDSQDSMLMLTNGAAPAQRHEAELFFDGGTDGSNPSDRGGCGWVLKNAYTGAEIVASSEYLTGADFSWASWQVTNNQAEYMGLLRGLEAARQQGIRRLKVKGDSLLVINQMSGHYAVRNPSISPLHRQCEQAAQYFSKIEYVHVYRERNTRADGLARAAYSSYY